MDVEQAAPSSAPVAIEIPRSGTSEYAEWRLSGTLPEKPSSKPETADTASADTSKETTSEAAKPEIAPGTEPGKTTQESRRKPGAEARIGELTAKLKRIETELEEARKPKSTQAEPSPAKASEPAAPQTYQEWRKAFKPTEWANKYATDNPQATWEDLMAAQADHLADVRDQYREREQQVTQLRQTVSQKLEEAKKRYPDYESVAAPVVRELLKPDVPREVFSVMNDSPVLADLLYTIGGTEESKADFLAACRSNPSKALRVALLMEQEIIAELAKGKSATESTIRNEQGQFVAPEPKGSITPAKKSPESASEPPIEINHRGSGPVDETGRAFKAGDFRAFKRAEDAKDMRRRRGA
jgi:hypothetical protein